MKKAVIQYRFREIITPPNDESGAIPYFLADYLLKNLDDATITHAAPFTQPEAHVCDLEDGEGTFVDIILPLDDDLLDGPATQHDDINRAVRQKLENCSFIVDEQVKCLNERFYVIEPYDRESIH